MGGKTQMEKLFSENQLFLQMVRVSLVTVEASVLKDYPVMKSKQNQLLSCDLIWRKLLFDYILFEIE